MTNHRRVLVFFHTLQIGIVESIIVSCLAEMGGRSTAKQIAALTGHKTPIISSTLRKLGLKGIISRRDLVRYDRHNQGGGTREWVLDIRILEQIKRLENRIPLKGRPKTNLTKKIAGRNAPRKRAAARPAGEKAP